MLGERGIVLDQDESGETSNGSEESRAGEGSSASSDGRRSRNGLVTSANGGGGRRRNSRSGRRLRLAGVARVAGSGASSARNLDGRVLNAGEDGGVLLGDGSHRLRGNALLRVAWVAGDGNRSGRNNGLLTTLSSGRVGVDGDGAVTGVLRLSRDNGLARLSRLSLGRRGRSGRLLVAGLGLSGRSGAGRLLVTGRAGLFRLAGLLRLSRLLAATSRLNGADGGGDSNGLGDNDGSTRSGRAVRNLGGARGDSPDVGRVDGRGGQGSLSGLRNFRDLLGGLAALLSRGDLGRDRVNGVAGDSRSSRAVGDLRTARGDGNSLGLVDLGDLGGHGTRGQESGGGSRVTHLEELEVGM